MSKNNASAAALDSNMEKAKQEGTLRNRKRKAEPPT